MKYEQFVPKQYGIGQELRNNIEIDVRLDKLASELQITREALDLIIKRLLK